MKIPELIALAVSFALGTLLMFVGQIYLFSEPVLPLTMTGREIDLWLEQILWPMTWILYITGVTLSLVWIVRGLSARFIKARDVLRNGLWWWLIAILFFAGGLLLFVSLSWFNGWFNPDLSLEPLYWFPPFIFLDTLLLFWFPTALASPRAFRYLPPGAFWLRKLHGG
ncbi:MAG: hypothetical protein GC158_00180 [Cyanobacteria bacterium RI_101]|nr:hypothetical protein [Cyanobacteria bacterium RI_101]